MTKEKTALFNRDTVETRQDVVLFNKLYWEPEEYSYRDKRALKSDNESIEQLAEDIRQSGGLLTPLLVRQLDTGKFLVLDGHRRKAAIELLVKGQTPGFDIESLVVPVNVIISEITKLEELMRSASANVSRIDFSKTERARVLKALYDEKCPEGEIQRILNIKKSQYDRDLLLSHTDWMMDLVEDKCVNYSTASRLLQVAKSTGMENALREALDEFVEKTKQALKAENKRRRANDQKEKTGDQLDPQKYLKADQVTTWEDDMRAGRQLSEAGFKFKALVSETKGVKTLEISSINRNLAEMGVNQISKVVKRLYDVLEELEPVAVTKRLQEEKQISRDTGSPGRSRGDLRLVELGLVFEDDDDEGLDGDFDEIDEGQERDEKDILDEIALGARVIEEHDGEESDEEPPKAALAAFTRPTIDHDHLLEQPEGFEIEDYPEPPDEFELPSHRAVSERNLRSLVRSACVHGESRESTKTRLKISDEKLDEVIAELKASNKL